MNAYRALPSFRALWRILLVGALSVKAPDACAQLVPWLNPGVPRVKYFGSNYGMLLRLEDILCQSLVKYPDLTPRVDSLLLRYDTLFSTAYVRYKAYLVQSPDKDQFGLQVQNIRAKTQDSGVSDTISRGLYTRILNRIDRTLKPVPVTSTHPLISTLFHFKYVDAPEREMTEGYTWEFQDKDFFNGDSLLYTLSIPRSWRLKAFKATDVAVFVSGGGFGLQTLQCSQQTIPRRRADKGVDWYLQPEHQKIISKQVGEALTAETFSGGFCPAGVIEPQEISSTLSKVRKRCYFFIDHGRINTLHFDLSIDEWGKPIEVEKHRALMDMIARSFRVRKM